MREGKEGIFETETQRGLRGRRRGDWDEGGGREGREKKRGVDVEKVERRRGEGDGVWERIQEAKKNI